LRERKKDGSWKETLKIKIAVAADSQALLDGKLKKFVVDRMVKTVIPRSFPSSSAGAFEYL
jgi:hypothetical protein